MEMNSSGVLFLENLSIKEVVMCSQACPASLQVFVSSGQLSGSRAGSWYKARDGVSLFRLLNR